MEFTGRIIAVLEARSGVSARTGNTWKTQDYVIEESMGQFPKRMVFNVFGEDNIQRFNIQMGQELTVSFDINAREYNGRWFNDIRAWNVVPATPAAPAAGAPVAAGTAPAGAAPVAAPATSTFESAEDSSSDLPFSGTAFSAGRDNE